MLQHTKTLNPNANGGEQVFIVSHFDAIGNVSSTDIMTNCYGSHGTKITFCSDCALTPEMLYELADELREYQRELKGL
jgi:hypothetical protein